MTASPPGQSHSDWEMLVQQRIGRHEMLICAFLLVDHVTSKVYVNAFKQLRRWPSNAVLGSDLNRPCDQCCYLDCLRLDLAIRLLAV